MEFPFGHNHPHHRRDEDPNREGGEFYRPSAQPYPPPPYYGDEPPPPPYYGDEPPPPPPPPPPPQVAHVYHTSHHAPSYGEIGSYPPPPDVGSDFYDRPPPPPAAASAPGNAYVEHVSHQSHHSHFPSFIHHHSQGSHNPEIATNKPTVRVYCKAESNYSLSIRDGKVILARADPSDPYQHWIKDEKYSTRVKDEEGFPSFSLINKATGQAMKHSIGASHPVQLIPYNPDTLDESILWTLSNDTGENFRTIRMVNNIRLNVDAFNGDKYHGGVHDGTTIVLWEWKKGENQRWKIVPY